MVSLKDFFRHALNRLRDTAVPVEVQEALAVTVVVASFVLVPVWVWMYDGATIEIPADARVIELTGIGSQGIWTTEVVSGLSYWWKTYDPADIVISPGEKVVLRLRSADVTHIFYAPTLGIGPVTVKPGMGGYAIVDEAKPGVHEYYCIAVCGECHYYMRGFITIAAEGQLGAVRTTYASFYSKDPVCALPNVADDLRAEEDLTVRGRLLFESVGCATCHGEKGSGGINNPNYIKGTVPALNLLHGSLGIEYEEDAEILVEGIRNGGSVDELRDQDLEIPRLRVVLAKYGIVRDVIRNGRPVARADTSGFDPPLVMPRWKELLSDRDIDAILVYLLTNQDWPEAEDEEEESIVALEETEVSAYPALRAQRTSIAHDVAAQKHLSPNR